MDKVMSKGENLFVGAKVAFKKLALKSPRNRSRSVSMTLRHLATLI
jgi:hypothetical protein